MEQQALKTLQLDYKEMDKRLDEVEKEIIVVKAKLASTDSRVEGLEITLRKISENTEWIKRTIIKAGVSTAFSLIAAIIIFLVTFYFSSGQ